MADPRKPPEATTSGRTRAAPTIDLTATDMSEPAAENPTEAAPEQQASEPAATAQEPPTSPPPENMAAGEPPRRGNAFMAAVAGIFFGAVVIAGVIAGLWYGGYIPSKPAEPSDLPARVAALEKQMHALESKPPPKFDTKPLDDKVAALTQRVSKIESALANPTGKDTAQRLTALDNTVKSLGKEVSTLNKRNDDFAAHVKELQQQAAAAEKAVNDLRQNPPTVTQGATPSANPDELNALQSKVAALAQTAGEIDALRKQVATLAQKVEAMSGAAGNAQNEIKSLRDAVASAQSKVAAAATAERATRLALSATALHNAVLSGAPYAAALAQAKSLGADQKALAPLDRFAASGVPSKNELAKELTKLMPAMLKIAGAQKPSGGILAQLQANASKLVRITPVETPAGDNPSDVLSRVEVAAAHADITGALADLAKLPDKVRSIAQDWIAKAKARQDALSAARAFAAQAARALGNG